MISKINQVNWKLLISIFLASAFILFMYGSVPYIATPTSAQAFWLIGFSNSFINESVFSIYANNIGLPNPAAISFGLAGAYLAGLFIAIGLYPPDAYALMVALWLMLGFLGAWGLAQKLGLEPLTAIFASLSWITLPMIWWHAAFSMVSLGLGLIPFYFWVVFQVVLPDKKNKVSHYGNLLLYIGAPLLAVFIDGYSFMMFATGSSLLILYLVVRFKDMRNYIILFVLPIHALAFACAYMVFALYIGHSQFDSASLDFFRGWAIDLTFLVIPTKGIHWLWDTLQLSIARSDATFFGDASTWITTFFLPIIATVPVAWWVMRKKTKLASGFLLITLCGFYMAMGPSLKVNSTKPGPMSPLMPAKLAIAPTGSSWISEKIPGFNNMRAAYRWSALGAFGGWALFIMLLAHSKRYNRVWVILILGLMIVSNLPHLKSKWMVSKANRDMFFNIDNALILDLNNFLKKDELVVFLPYGNDFLINYLAPRLGVRTYNIGGDKNLIEARKHWPQTLRFFKMDQVDPDFAGRIQRLLANHEADAVVLPYIHMLEAAHKWPVPLVNSQKLAPVIAHLKASGVVSVEERRYYAIVRMKQGVDFKIIQSLTNISYPMTIAKQPSSFESILSNGWYGLEPTHVWSGAEAKLNLPVPNDCIPNECSVILTLLAYGASSTRPVEVIIQSDVNLLIPSSIIFDDPPKKRITIPLVTSSKWQPLVLKIPNAISPKNLQGSADPRVLGVALFSIELMRQQNGIYGHPSEDEKAN